MSSQDPQRDETVAVLFRGGRLPTWEDLDPAVRRAHEQEHVDLMLEVAREHGLLRIEGFRLITRTSRGRATG